jgi:hypothetical protein
MKLVYVLLLSVISVTSYAIESLSEFGISSHSANYANQSLPANINHLGYFTEFQLTLKNDLILTGQLTRLHDSYNAGYGARQILRPVEWSLTTESRSSTAREIELNWTLAAVELVYRF